MALCHECGSEVAENDVFCPFCGISLNPIEVEDGETDPAFESTIVMSSPSPNEAPATRTADETASGQKFSEAEPTRTNTTDPHFSAGPTDQDLSISNETHDSAAEHHIDDVPVPAVLTELESTAGHLFEGLNDRKSERLEEPAEFHSVEPEPSEDPIAEESVAGS